MKKLAAAILLLVYFTVTTGFMVSVHYCMNKLDSVELGYSAKEECGKCGMHVVKSKGCCKDEVKVVKLHTDHQAAKITSPDFTLFLFDIPHETAYLQPRFQQANATFALAHGPPLSAQPIYLLHCVFRI